MHRKYYMCERKSSILLRSMRISHSYSPPHAVSSRRFSGFIIYNICAQNWMRCRRQSLGFTFYLRFQCKLKTKICIHTCVELFYIDATRFGVHKYLKGEREGDLMECARTEKCTLLLNYVRRVYLIFVPEGIYRRTTTKFVVVLRSTYDCNGCRLSDASLRRKKVSFNFSRWFFRRGGCARSKRDKERAGLFWSFFTARRLLYNRLYMYIPILYTITCT